MNSGQGKPILRQRVWLADLAYTQQSVSSETMPQAVGGLATFATAFLTFAQPVRIFKYPERLAAALDTLGPPDLLGFSHYIWNSYLSRAVARMVKQAAPDCVVVFGGPHFPAEPAERETFLRAHPEIDFYIANEGEIAFVELLLALHRAGWAPDALDRQPPSTWRLGPDGAPGPVPAAARVRDLAAIPSPYTAGLMDEFFDGKLVPTLTTNRGCPFSCTFCLEGQRYYSKVYKSPVERVRDELHYMGRRMAELLARGPGRNELLITDSNFGMFPEDRLTCEVIAECQDAYGWPKRVNVTTGKNHRERVLSAVRSTRGAILLSGAVQSLDPDVLANIKRSNINTDRLMEIALAADAGGTGTYSDVVLGLPGDTPARHRDTLRRLVDAGFGYINTFQLALLPGTELAEPASRRAHGLVSGFRLMPRGHGTVATLGQRAVVAEIDEVCIGSSSMSFADHLDCRLMDLYVFVFYNDRAFGGAVAVLRRLKLSVFDWIERVAGLTHLPEFQRVLDEFVAETVDGCWSSREELERYLADPANHPDVVSGRLANNLLYTYRARALVEALDGVVDAATRAGDAFLADGGATDEQRAFFADVTAHDGARLRDVFTPDPLATVVGELRFDVPAFLTDTAATDVAAYRLPAPARCRYTLSDEQRALVAQYQRLFGTDPAGVGRTLSRVALADLSRSATLS